MTPRRPAALAFSVPFARLSSRLPGLPRLSALAAAAATAVLAAGCATTTPQPLATTDMVQLAAQDAAAARAQQVPVSGAITLEEALARALKYNLDHRVRLLEQALASGQLEAGRFDMLPKLLANAGYTSRDNDATRRSADPANTSQFSTTTPYISSERNHRTLDLGLSWNLLDFGASYYTAQQNADRLLVAGERRRKAMHTLVQNVRTAYWRALAAQRLAQPVRAAIAEAESALTDSRAIAAARVRAPGETLRYQRNLLENLRLLEGLERELSSARIELAGLIGVPAATRLELVEPQGDTMAPLTTPIEQLEATALARNADLKESSYAARIAVAETRKSLLRLLPGISFDVTARHDTDKYLVNQQWQDAGVRVSFNLFNLLAAPSQIRAAELGTQVAAAQRMALQMTVLTQVHLAWHGYDDALKQYRRAVSLSEVDDELARIATGQEASQLAGRLERISASVSAILSTTKRYQAMARVQESASRLQALLGLEPEIGSLDDTDLPTLQKDIGRSLNRWAAVDGATNLVASDDAQTPGTAVVATTAGTAGTAAR